MWRKIKHGLTTGPPRSSWAERTQVKAMTRATMLMIAFIISVYVLMDQIWELWSPHCYVVTLSEERAEYRPESRSCRRKTRTRVKILRGLDFRAQFSMTELPSWRGGPGSSNKRTRRLNHRRQLSNLLSSKYHFWIMVHIIWTPDEFFRIFMTPSSHNIILPNSTNRCRPRVKGHQPKRGSPPWDGKSHRNSIFFLRWT
jgi:hypothetical protein